MGGYRLDQMDYFCAGNGVWRALREASQIQPLYAI